LIEVIRSSGKEMWRVIFESEIVLIPPSLKISESSSNGSYRNTAEVWWRYGISRSCDEWYIWQRSHIYLEDKWYMKMTEIIQASHSFWVGDHEERVRSLDYFMITYPERRWTRG
jgi:hypothetical protein